MRFKHISSDEITLWVPVTIKAKELNGLLSGADKTRYIDFDIQICFIARNTEYGLFTEYTGQWATSPVGNYPARILDAINNYLNSINVTETFKKEIRLCGIPIYIARKLDLQTEDKPRQIGFQQIGDTSLLEVDNED